jgi:hypothetical protein
VLFDFSRSVKSNVFQRRREEKISVMAFFVNHLKLLKSYYSCHEENIQYQKEKLLKMLKLNMLKVTPAMETKADPVPNPVHQLRVYDGGLLCVSDNCKSLCATVITFESRGQLLCRTSAIPTFPPLLLGRRRLQQYKFSELWFSLILAR